MKIYNVVYDFRGHIEVYPCANEKVALKKVRELSLQALTYEGIEDADEILDDSYYSTVYNNDDMEFTLQFAQRSLILDTDFTDIAHIYVDEKEVLA